MKIDFERSGGVMGMSTTVSLDTDIMGAEAAAELEGLVATAAFFELPAQLVGDGPMPDEYSYVITIERNGEAHTVTCTDSSAPDGLRPLLVWLDRAAREARGN